MQEFAAWLHNMSERPLPGGVSAAALAAAMGAALLAKTARVSLRKQDMSAEDRATMQAMLDVASQQQQILFNLVKADEEAYRAVLAARVLAARGHPDPLQPKAEPWHRATEVPVCVAEACHLLLKQLPGLEELCLPIVRPDLDIGRWLLDTGLRTGLLAAKSNLRAWTGEVDQASLQARLAVLGADDLESSGP